MHATIVTLFPELFAPFLEQTVLGRAVEAERIRVDILPMREHGEGKHRIIDDRPFGGGPGMVLLAEPVVQAVEAARAGHGSAVRTIVMSPQGRRFDQALAQELAEAPDGFVFVCGRYEGIDERALEVLQPEEVSLGDFVLSAARRRRSPCSMRSPGSSRCPGPRGLRARGLLLRSRGTPRPSALHAPGRLARQGGPRRAALRQPCGDRGVAARAGARAHGRATTRPAAALRGRRRGGGLMFTGIVTHRGTLEALEERGELLRLVVRPDRPIDGLAIGDSVAHDGCCLTVVAMDDGALTYEAIPETLRKTTLGERAVGDLFNLEAAMRTGDALGGHWVQGHVDGVGTIRAIEQRAKDIGPCGGRTFSSGCSGDRWGLRTAPRAATGTGSRRRSPPPLRTRWPKCSMRAGRDRQ